MEGCREAESRLPRDQQDKIAARPKPRSTEEVKEEDFVRFKVKAQLDKSQKDSVLLCKRRLYSTNLDKSQKDYSRSVSY